MSWHVLMWIGTISCRGRCLNAKLNWSTGTQVYAQFAWNVVRFLWRLRSLHTVFYDTVAVSEYEHSIRVRFHELPRKTQYILRRICSTQSGAIQKIDRLRSLLPPSQLWSSCKKVPWIPSNSYTSSSFEKYCISLGYPRWVPWRKNIVRQSDRIT